MSNTRCYHCDLPVPNNVDFSVDILGQRRAMCCPGCQAVAAAIVDGGLDRFYRYRTGALDKPEASPDSDIDDRLKVYDLAEIQADFVTRVDGKNQAQFIVQGITCSACAWLIEHYLSRLDGVATVTVNVTNHRCWLQWDPNKIPLSRILHALQSIGYQARPANDVNFQQLRDKDNKQYLLRLGVAGLAMMQAGMVAIGLYAGDYYGIETRWQSLLRWVSFFLVTPVVFYSARPFFVAAWRSLRLKLLVMDVPVALAISLAYAASTWATFTGTGEVYFDSVSMFTFFLLLGRYLEMRVRYRNESLAYSFTGLVPPAATRITAQGEETVPVKSLKPGDTIRVASGATIPCDGEVVKGGSEVTEAVLTGEQQPVAKTINAAVSAGTVNIANPLEIKVSATGEATRLATILNLADSSAAAKPRQAALADQLAGWFVGAVLIIAVVAGGIWWNLDPDRALWVVLSILVVTCPCALSLATPAALTVATGALRRGGFLIRQGHVLETLAKASRCVFDKTGTLTMGNMKITDLKPITNIDNEQILKLGAGLEQGSAHPIAKAFQTVSPPLPAFEHTQFNVGQGVTGNYQGELYALGKPAFVCLTLGLQQCEGETGLLFGNSKGLLAWIQFADEIRPGAEHMVEDFSQLGINLELLSGDQSAVVEQLAAALAIKTWQGGATPADKLARIKSLQASGEKIIMVGDGINDIPVLSAADVSIAMGDAADLTRLHADSILVAGHLRVLPWAVKMARKTRTIIRQNLGWALLYNLIALPLACLGLIPPWAAAIGMSASSLVVVLNALRLNRQQGELQAATPLNA